MRRLKANIPAEILAISLRQGVGQEVIRINGPNDQSNGEELHYGAFISARVISTYPHVPAKPLRDGDPICDRIGVVGFENRCIVTLTDGCNWGAKARDASLRANDTFLKVMEEHVQVCTTRSSAYLLPSRPLSSSLCRSHTYHSQ
jgi:hypothetical protein